MAPPPPNWSKPLRWLIRFAFACVLPRTEQLLGVEDTDVDGFIRAYLAETHPLMKIGLYLATLVFVLSPLITIGVPLPAFLLPASWRDAHARRAASHPFYVVRQLVVLLKLAAGFCWAGDPEVRRRLGLQPLGPDPGTFRGSSP